MLTPELLYLLSWKYKHLIVSCVIDLHIVLGCTLTQIICYEIALYEESLQKDLNSVGLLIIIC